VSINSTRVPSPRMAWRPGLTLEDIRRGVSKLQSGYALESCGSFFTLAISLAALERLT